MQNTIAFILGGGKGTRLFPLTKDRSKPAVPIGGKYRLIDIPVSNCLHSRINNIFILTQFNSASLSKHINQAYRFDSFHGGFVDVLAAEQSNESDDWYQGTADAVRKNLKHLNSFPEVKYVLILSGDQIYSMDYRKLIEFHEQNGCEISIPVIPVTKKETEGFGILKLSDSFITDFTEKPKTEEARAGYNNPELIKQHFPNINPDKEYLASMGIYLFSRDVLAEVLNNNESDFGHEIIPMSIKNKKVGGYLFDGYWEDVGTIESFLDANIDFASLKPAFNFYENHIFTNARHLPPSKVSNSEIEEALLGEGSIIQNASIKKSVIGIRSIILDDVSIETSVIMGADYYENSEERDYNRTKGIINLGIGKGSTIRNAIIDKNSRIGKNCKIINEKGVDEFDGGTYYIRSGVVIIPKNSQIPDNTVI